MIDTDSSKSTEETLASLHKVRHKAKKFQPAISHEGEHFWLILTGTNFNEQVILLAEMS